MAFERLKVLAAAAGMDPGFTVAGLAAESGVAEATVRSVVSRDQNFFQVGERTVTGKPGGQPITYTFVDGGRDRVLAQVREFASVVQDPPPVDVPPSVPPSLLAAEGWLLGSGWGAEKDASRTESLGASERRLRAARKSMSEPEGDTAEALRLRAAEWAARLQRTELLFAKGRVLDTGEVEVLRKEFAESLWPELLALQDGGPENRIERSLLKRYLSVAADTLVFRDTPLWKLLPPAAPGYVLVLDAASSTAATRRKPKIEPEPASLSNLATRIVEFLDLAGVRNTSAPVAPAYPSPWPEADLLVLTMFSESDQVASAVALCRDYVEHVGRRRSGVPDVAVVAADFTTGLSQVVAQCSARPVQWTETVAGAWGDALFGSRAALRGWSDALSGGPDAYSPRRGAPGRGTSQDMVPAATRQGSPDHR